MQRMPVGAVEMSLTTDRLRVAVPLLHEGLDSVISPLPSAALGAVRVMGCNEGTEVPSYLSFEIPWTSHRAAVTTCGA